MTERKKIVCRYSWDMNKLLGVPLEEAAKYLLQLAKEAPAGAWLEDTTQSYDQMVIDVLFKREETDEEYANRLEWERIKLEAEERDRKAAAEKEARRKEWLKLKKEFGGY